MSPSSIKAWLVGLRKPECKDLCKNLGLDDTLKVDDLRFNLGVYFNNHPEDLPPGFIKFRAEREVDKDPKRPITPVPLLGRQEFQTPTDAEDDAAEGDSTDQTKTEVPEIVVHTPPSGHNQPNNDVRLGSPPSLNIGLGSPFRSNLNIGAGSMQMFNNHRRSNSANGTSRRTVYKSNQFQYPPPPPQQIFSNQHVIQNFVEDIKKSVAEILPKMVYDAVMDATSHLPSEKEDAYERFSGPRDLEKLDRNLEDRVRAVKDPYQNLKSRDRDFNREEKSNFNRREKSGFKKSDKADFKNRNKSDLEIESNFSDSEDDFQSVVSRGKRNSRDKKKDNPNVRHFIKEARERKLRFAGNSKDDIKIFFKKIERVRGYFTLTDQEMRVVFPDLLVANSAAERFLDSNKEICRTWNDIKRVFAEAFPSQVDPNQLKIDMHDRKQIPTERIDFYISLMKTLNEKLQKPLNEEAFFDMILENLAPDYQDMLLQREVNNIDELLVVCRSGEKVIERKNRYKPPAPRLVRPLAKYDEFVKKVDTGKNCSAVSVDPDKNRDKSPLKADADKTRSVSPGKKKQSVNFRRDNSNSSHSSAKSEN